MTGDSMQMGAAHPTDATAHGGSRLLAADHQDVLEHFGVVGVPPESIYPYSPVFAGEIDGRRVVIKRTRSKPDAAAAIATWTRAAAEAGVPVVRPVTLPVANPASIGGGNWVAYPFVEGEVYTGSVDQIAAASDLLGRLHAARTATLPPPFSWPDPGEESIVEDETALSSVVAPHAPAAARRLSELVRRFPTSILPAVRRAELPESAIITDYKANNLIYTEAGPVLIDPDNADTGPRLFDLAFAALQFHSEHPPGPDRMFSEPEWAAFRDAYLRRVDLTSTERELWPTVVEYVLSEESVWTLVESDDWDDDHERAFLLDLARADASRFPLP